MRSLVSWRRTELGGSASRLAAEAFRCAIVVLVILAVSDHLPSEQTQEREKLRALRWEPPRVDVPVPSLSATPACLLSDVLKAAGQRAEELVEHLQNFIAHEQIRYEQIPSGSMAGLTGITGIGLIAGQPENMSFTGKFDYIVEFGKRSEPLRIRERRTALKGTADANLDAIVGKGLPVLALIFHPSMQGDYEMRCEGASSWKNQPAWVVHFSQRKGKRPRTVTMETASELALHEPNRTEIRPLRLAGRAWVAADSGQVMHLETNLLEKLPLIELEESAFSVDYAPVKFKAQNAEVWLPQFAIGYTDYAGRRMIVEHAFSDFELFSVQTQDVIHKAKEP
jgi:hypothetical protein